MRDPISIPARCAETGGRFHLCFTWSPARERYVLFSVLPEAEASVPATRGHVSSGGASSGGSPRPGQKLAGLPATNQFKAQEIDFTGSYCPHCGYGKTRPVMKYRFVRCGECQELVCAARITVDASQHMFHCSPRCGARAAITGEPLTSYTGQAHTNEQQEQDTLRVTVTLVPPSTLPAPERPGRPPIVPPPALPTPKGANLPAINRTSFPAPNPRR